MEENNNNTITNGEESKTYTQEEVDALLQQEGDRRVSAALKKQEKKNQEKVKEAEKLAQMNEAEKYEYQLKQREMAILEKERELAIIENKNEASKILAEKGISLSLVDFIVAEDAETMKANIDLLDKAFKASVKEEVEKRLATSTPKKNLVDSDSITREKFIKLPLNEQQKMLNENPMLRKMIYGG